MGLGALCQEWGMGGGWRLGGEGTHKVQICISYHKSQYHRYLHPIWHIQKSRMCGVTHEDRNERGHPWSHM